ncbi:hypothetical protein PCL_10673 [Purpureocillium lilacinum]|uniref:Uncharacterized protein n=1 Tax=Purpureocillium lilacinum TaxID=33203 RepID=A0A2U3EC52_PURLI|nr:hypothetical protein Purlil1_1364 [Purpureocillium lilacinum]PWI72050.1 hypothetical protein PCL_10673 [Purpureocillium lilacinum]
MHAKLALLALPIALWGRAATAVTEWFPQTVATQAEAEQIRDSYEQGHIEATCDVASQMCSFMVAVMTRRAFAGSYPYYEVTLRNHAVKCPQTSQAPARRQGFRGGQTEKCADGT